MPTPIAPDKPHETFLLSTDVTGLIWHGEPGWSGCLRQPTGDTNFVGPFKTIVGARMAVRSEYATGLAAAVIIEPAQVRGL